MKKMFTFLAGCLIGVAAGALACMASGHFMGGSPNGMAQDPGDGSSDCPEEPQETSCQS